MCTIVSSNHYGPIPGVEVGAMWKFRVQVRHTCLFPGRENVYVLHYLTSYVSKLLDPRVFISYEVIECYVDISVAVSQLF